MVLGYGVAWRQHAGYCCNSFRAGRRIHWITHTLLVTIDGINRIIPCQCVRAAYRAQDTSNEWCSVYLQTCQSGEAGVFWRIYGIMKRRQDGAVKAVEYAPSCCAIAHRRRYRIGLLLRLLRPPATNLCSTMQWQKFRSLGNFYNLSLHYVVSYL